MFDNFWVFMAIIAIVVFAVMAVRPILDFQGRKKFTKIFGVDPTNDSSTLWPWVDRCVELEMLKLYRTWDEVAKTLNNHNASAQGADYEEVAEGLARAKELSQLAKTAEKTAREAVRLAYRFQGINPIEKAGLVWLLPIKIQMHLKENNAQAN
jgi:hypothetical protein